MDEEVEDEEKEVGGFCETFKQGFRNVACRLTMYVSDFAEASLRSLHLARLLDCRDLRAEVKSPTSV